MTDTRKRKKNSPGYFKRLYDRFIRIRGTPRQIALGFALGIFVGMTPTMGFQIVIALFLAAFLKWNKISATFGVFITNPITAPFIYGLTYLVGSKVLGFEKVLVIPDVFSLEGVIAMLERTPRIFAALILGGIIVGAPLAVISYLLVYAISSASQQKLQRNTFKGQKNGKDS